MHERNFHSVRYHLKMYIYSKNIISIDNITFSYISLLFIIGCISI